MAAAAQPLKRVLACHRFLLNTCKKSNNNSIKKSSNNQPFCLRLLYLYHSLNEAEIALRKHSPISSYASIGENAS